MDRGEIRETVLSLTGKVFLSLTDLTLYTLYLLGASIGKSPTSRGTYQMFKEADKAFSQFNGETIRQSFAYLKRKGLVKVAKEELYYKPIITQAGIKKLKSSLPEYDPRRVWDGRLYLITYDIAEEAKKDREILREFILKRIGAGSLQDSVYLTFYNPKEILKKFAEERGLSGSIIVSDLGKDGSVGEEDLSNLIRKIFKLDQLEERYREFIERYQKPPKNFSLLTLSFDFYSILADDPQIPFELLPHNWIGQKAYSLFKKFTNLKRNAKSKYAIAG